MTSSVSGLRMAIVNWRDPWHPAAGGAERYAWEIARRFAADGGHVRYVTCRAPGQRRRSRVDGVEFIRLGGRFTVYPLVLLWMLSRRRAFDAVIDCQNGIPFFTPLVLPRGVPVFCVIHHVHDRQFGLYFPAWLAWTGRLLEGPVARWAYRRHACLVVSLSTRRAVRERLGWRVPAYVVPNGHSVPAAGQDAVSNGRARRGAPELVCVSRLVPHKRVERIVDLADRLRLHRPGLRVHIVGDGPEAPALAEAVAARGLAGVVILHGFVPEEVKAALVAGADLHLSTSRGEGWGLSVVEAAALGVPTVAYDVEGLREAVRDGITGWLVAEGEDDVERAADGAGAGAGDGAGGDLVEVVERALKELDDPVRRREMAVACGDWAARFDWARTASRAGALVAAAVSTGSASSDDDRAHVAGGGDGRPRVVEGPVRDLLLRDRPAEELRPATALERLLGHPDEEHR